MIETNLVNNIFEFLPRSKEVQYLKKEDKIKLVKESGNRLNSKHNYYHLCKNVVELLCERLSTEDNDYLWSIDDYLKTKGHLSKIRNNQIQYLEDFIINTLKTNNYKIIKELYSFSKITTWYPDRVKIKENNKYIYKEEVIQLTDIFTISTRIVSLMQRSINETAKKLLEDTKDLDTICELIKEIKEDELRSNKALEKFDEEYGFLENFSLLKIIYLNVRGNYFNILLENLRILHNKQNRNKLTENYRKNYLAKIERRKEKKALYDKTRVRTKYY